MELSSQIYYPVTLPWWWNSQCPLYRRLVGLQRDCRILDKKIDLAPTGNRTPDRPACSLVTVSTERSMCNVSRKDMNTGVRELIGFVIELNVVHLKKSYSILSARSPSRSPTSSFCTSAGVMDLGTAMWCLSVCLLNNDLLKGYKLQPHLKRKMYWLHLALLTALCLAWHHGRCFTDFRTNRKYFSTRNWQAVTLSNQAAHYVCPPTLSLALACRQCPPCRLDVRVLSLNTSRQGINVQVLFYLALRDTRKSIALFECFQCAPACPSEESSFKMKMIVNHCCNNTDKAK